MNVPHCKELNLERAIEACHVSVETNTDFDRFTRALERSLGRFDATLLKELETNPDLVEERLKEIGIEY